MCGIFYKRSRFWENGKTTFALPGPLHPLRSPWKFPHPFHGRLTSNMACKRCEQQVINVFVYFSYHVNIRYLAVYCH